MANQQQIRRLLWAHPEGLTAKQIATELNADVINTHAQVKKMVDTYILAWTIVLGRPRAIWAVAITPEDCPRPMKQDRVLKAYAR
jgi:hypothetical protein